MVRWANKANTFRDGTRAARRVSLRLRATFLIACLATLLWPGLSFAVPPGTVISNTAQVSYDVSSSTYTINSNTDQFTVESLLPADQADVTVAGYTNNKFYPGSTTNLDITIDNSGSNDLTNGFLTIDAPTGSNVNLTGTDVTLVAETGSSKKYTVSDLATAGSMNYQAQLTLPMDTAAGANSVTINYEANGSQIQSQGISLDVSPRSQGVLRLMQYSDESDATPITINQTEYRKSDGTFAAMSVPELEQVPGVKVTDAPVTLKETTKFSHRQTIFINLEDPDQNTDKTQTEIIEVSLAITADGEEEILRLTETGNDTGLFTGYIMLKIDTAAANDGMLEVHPDTEVDFDYTDKVDNSDTNLKVVLVDPFGILFDSATGARLNGYTVHMVNADTGQPAMVYGDDGVSTYPATVVTGGSVTDSGGTVYHFADGAYRFPFAPVGNYKLVVEPPAGADYRWPSDQPLELINQLPEAPYAITLGSRAEVFPLNPGPPLHIDIPIDPLTKQLYVQRTANKTSVAPGDFIQYQVTVENVAGAALSDVTLTDTLPRGFRLETKSLMLDDTPLAAAVSINGNELSFDLGAMVAGDSHTIEYVASVGAVNRGAKSSSSSAIANGGAAVSNTSEHDIRIIDEFMRSRALLMGQVLVEPRSGDNNKPANGLAGIRIYMEDGRYAVTDERGMYHFEDVKPGSHVVQLDLDTLPEQYEVVLSEDNTRFAGRAWSQFVDVQGGTLWRTDFHVAPKPIPEGNVAIQISNQAQLDSGAVPYRIDIQNETVAVNNMRLNVLIPEGMVYLSGSSHLGGRTIDDPVINDNMLTFRLGDTDATKWQKPLRYTLIDSAAETGAHEMITKAFLLFDTPSKGNQRTPVADHVLVAVPDEKKETIIEEEFIITPDFPAAGAELNKDEKFALNKFIEKITNTGKLRIHAIGHADATDTGDKQKLSQQRALAVAGYLQQQLQLSPESVTAEGRGAQHPFSGSDTATDRQLNRRVQIFIYRVNKETTGTTRIEANSGEQQTVATQGKDPLATETDNTSRRGRPEETEVIYDAAWLKGKQPTIELLQPQPDELPKQTSTPITVKHHKEQSVELMLNGKPVSRVSFEGSIKNDQGATLSMWKGVDLKTGNNHLVAIIKDKSGAVEQRISRTLHVSGAVAKAKLVKEQSSLIADGRTTPVIALRMVDKDGYPLRPGMGGQFHIKPPYRVTDNTELDLEVMPGSSTQNLQRFSVGADGVALIELEPTSKTGTVEIELTRPNQEKQLIEAKLKAEKRDWILVGLAEGTTGHQVLKGNTEALSGDAARDGIYQDGRLAFFAKGQILGKWLLTLAYDSDKERVRGEDPELFQTIDPDSYYTVYGDSANDGNEAPSSEKLYLKLERDEFYVLFGDYNTDFNDTELAVYSRTLTGVKSEYEDETYDITVFTSQTNQSFVKDEFRGEGRSGPYQLSRSNIAMNSEKVVIETRNRLRSEEITETVELQRHSDYDIDYRDGTITFRKPVFSVDQKLNHVFIVVKYEAYDDADEEATYGIRAKAKLNDKLSVGVTHVNEGRTGGEAKLGGVDAEYQLTDNTKVRVEAARTIDSRETGSHADGNAYIAEVEHQTYNNSSKAYVRETDTGFGLGQTNGSEDSTRKIGAETNIQATDSINLHGQAYRQEQTTTNATRDLAEAEAQMNLDIATLNLGVRSAVDKRGDGSKQKSEQITSGVSKGFLDNRLIARAEREQNLSSGNSIDFPDRTRLGVDYRLSNKVSLFAEQELTDGDIRDNRNTLLGVKANPWDGGTLYTGVTNAHSAAGEATSANVAGTQTWQLTDTWSLNVGAEQSKLISATPGTQLNANVPFASGSTEDFTAASLGITYLEDDWMWTGRIENRNGETRDDRSLATSVQTTPNNALSLLASLSLNESEGSSGEKQEQRNIGLGLAYRPIASRWILLDKLEFITNDTTGTSFDSEEERIINMFHANYKRNRWQLSLQYGAKTVTETINQQNYTSFTDLFGFETRYDLTRNWDIGLHGNILRARELDHYDYRTGVSIGHSVADNIWISLGYNFTGFRDEDFSRSNYTSDGVFMRLRVKFDQQSVKEGLEWLKK